MPSGQPPDERTGSVPEASRPGHHPEVEQDRPLVPPGGRRFEFAFEGLLLPFGVPFGVTPRTAWVKVTLDQIDVRFGLWSLRTPLENVDGVEATGPFQFWKVAGPAHVSFADRGLTFATSTRRGVCVRFRRRVRPSPPLPTIDHPALTVTVEDVDGLMELLEAVVARRSGSP